MRQLIPPFIHENYLEGKYSGYFIGSVISVDIKGFTPLTETLMKSGKYGAEILSEVINEIFEKAIHIISENNGFITTFAGDAFTAVFPKDCLKYSLRAGREIRSYINELRNIKTQYGTFPVSIRIGLAFGRVYWGIASGKRQCSYYFRGRVIANASIAQQECQPGKINICSTVEKKEDHYHWEPIIKNNSEYKKTLNKFMYLY